MIFKYLKFTKEKLKMDRKFKRLEYLEPRTLEKICTEEGGNFYRIWNGNLYCSLANGKRINCKYLSKERDHNGLYCCTYEVYKEIRDAMMEKYERRVIEH